MAVVKVLAIYAELPKRQFLKGTDILPAPPPPPILNTSNTLWQKRRKGQDKYKWLAHLKKIKEIKPWNIYLPNLVTFNKVAVKGQAFSSTL